ncbi:LysR family transcriptional regulator [Paraburkholderia tropica]|uniref:LysR family transcriptional regulator n=1 Tax=Paraburkholderia tropica TaxID=92647 RepID=UPI001CB64A04|nr:LysR family transcriptional regulator [Paraburkholderia tropica]CAG9201985.1 LysR family transcriptional regulator [Paraburkholderia tropica]
MQFSLDQLEVFVTATREPSFSATARRLGKAQSAVSTAIGELEIDLGVTLFDRRGRYPVLTPEGEALLSEAEAVLSRCDGLRERASALTSKQEARIAIGVEDAFPRAALVPVLKRLPERFPAVQVDVRQPSDDDLLEMVLKERVSLGLGCARAQYPAGIGFCRLGQVTFVNVAHRDHPLARYENVRFAQLSDQLHLLLAGQNMHLLTAEYLKSPRTWTVQSHAMLVDLLKDGVGWTSVPRWSIEKELAAGELVELKLEAYPFTEWTVGLDLLWKAESTPGTIALWLKSELMRTASFA